MKRARIASLVAAALVAGVVAGSAASGFAAGPTDATPTSTTATGMGLRLGGAMRGAGGRLADIVAKLTGLDVDDVQAKRADGTSFADVAASKGVSVDKVADEALSVREDVLDAKVEDGSISQDQADDALDRMQGRLIERIQATDGGCAGTGGGGCGGGLGGGRGGRGCSGAGVTQ